MGRGRPDDTTERSWFESLYSDHYESVYRYLLRRVGPEAVDDVVAEVFIAAWRHRARRPEVELPWLYGVAANHALHLHRSHRRRALLLTRIGTYVTGHAPANDPAPEAIARLDIEALLSRLPALDAEILRLVTWEQLSPEQIAQVLQITPTAARVRLHRARRRAAKLIGPAPFWQHGLADDDFTAKEIQ